MATDAQRRASQKYDAENTVMFAFKFNRKTDADLIQKLQEVPNRQAYLKSLIRADLDRSK